MNENFRNNLRRLRVERGLDATNLSVAAGMSRRGVTDIERGASGSPKLINAIALADQLGVSLMEMLGAPGRHSLEAEWRDFLSQFPEERQRKYLAAVRSLRDLLDE